MESNDSRMTPQQIDQIILGSESDGETTRSDEGSGSTVLPTTDGAAEWRVCVFHEDNKGVRHVTNNIPLLETMKKYCDKFGYSIENVRFKYDEILIGVINKKKTLELDDDRIKEVVFIRIGD